MTRTDAVTVAWSRAQEQRTECPLFTDPYAQLFVDAAVQRGWQPPPGHILDGIRSAGGYTASRTKWFDEFLIAAGAAGITQAVILAAGLDARAWRLPWVSGTVVYEIDRPRVLTFKIDTLREHEATPGAGYVPVPIDLRDDWPRALLDAGFDPTEPTAWAAEGLLPCLPVGDQESLFERVHDLSARDSRIGVETLEPDRLTGHGWDVTVVSAADLMSRYGRCAAGDPDETTPRTWFVEGKRDR